MMAHRKRFPSALFAGLLLSIPSPAEAQAPPILAAVPLRLESWRAASPLDRGLVPQAGQIVWRLPNRKRNALVGGAIGAAAGVVTCTVVSTLVNDSAEGGLSFCPLDSYLLIGGAGFVVGAVVGWLL